MKLKFLQERKQKKIAPFLREVFPEKNAASLFSRLASFVFGNKILGMKSKKKKLLAVAIVSSLAFFGLKFLFLNVLSVKKSEQKKGLGKKFLDLLENHAKKNGFSGMFLFSNPERIGAQKLYKNKGFLEILRYFFWKKF